MHRGIWREPFYGDDWIGQIVFTDNGEACPLSQTETDYKEIIEPPKMTAWTIGTSSLAEVTRNVKRRD